MGETEFIDNDPYIVQTVTYTAVRRVGRHQARDQAGRGIPRASLHSLLRHGGQLQRISLQMRDARARGLELALELRPLLPLRGGWVLVRERGEGAGEGVDGLRGGVEELQTTGPGAIVAGSQSARRVNEIQSRLERLAICAFASRLHAFAYPGSRYVAWIGVRHTSLSMFDGATCRCTHLRGVRARIHVSGG